MPQYEYICDQDEEVIVLLRPMKESDDKVEDPTGRGRTFRRKLSAFGVTGTNTQSTGAHVHVGNCCPCGKPQSACGNQ
ncbi:MAG: zinc ribbon domain-containing protein [Phycisphaerales bacterium]|nr:zinc ribbon domain-containing protein [Phycisphaerales bacterium]